MTLTDLQEMREETPTPIPSELATMFDVATQLLKERDEALRLIDTVEMLRTQRDRFMHEKEEAEARAEAMKALKEAYREVAIAIDRQFIGGLLNPIKYHEDNIDAEAQRILSERKSK